MCDSGKSSLGTCFFDILKIDAYANTSILLGHEDDVRNPVKIIYCLNEINIKVRRQVKNRQESTSSGRGFDRSQNPKSSF